MNLGHIGGRRGEYLKANLTPIMHNVSVYVVLKHKTTHWLYVCALAGTSFWGSFFDYYCGEISTLVWVKFYLICPNNDYGTTAVLSQLWN